MTDPVDVVQVRALLAAATPGTWEPCSWEGCTATAVVALTFRGQPGHVHVCAPHEAVDREWCDVTWAAPMPCPIQHDGTEWDATPELLP